MEHLRKKHAKKIRYGIVGGANTALDFILLFIFVHLGMHKIPANYLSTGITFIISFAANRRFTFKSTKDPKKLILPFIIVTLIGIWVIQPALIALVSGVLYATSIDDSVVLFASKLIATGGSLVWNYILYNKVVFKED